MAVHSDPDHEELAAQIHELSALSEPGEEGWTRRVFSEAYRAQRDWIARAFTASGCTQVHRDHAGNIVGRFPGRRSDLAPLVIGSHTDTVQGGGRYDGVVGVLGALAALRALRDRGTALERDLLVYDFLGEEVNAFGIGCLGSKGALGQLSAADLSRTDPATGRTLGRAYEDFGLETAPLLRAPRRPDWHAYLELHIEQATSLERSGDDIGVVVGIAGIRRLVAQFVGEQNHAGGARMDERRDALLAAARAALRLNEMACSATEFAVATTTHLDNESQALNVVPSRVRLRAEMRSTDGAWLNRAERRLAQQIEDDSRALGVEVGLSWLEDDPVALCDDDLQSIIAASSDHLGLSWRSVPSGATHDAAHIATACPAGMIFVPSVGGLSHTPEEFTEHRHLRQGVDVLERSLVLADRPGG